MQYVRLGTSGLVASRVGFGCTSLLSYCRGSVRLVNKAIDLGINYFDTADLYHKGANEIIVGKCLKRRRSDVIIASKVGNVWNPDGVTFHWNPSKRHILKSIDDSLARLDTDYIDLYQLHGGKTDDPFDETMEALEILVQQGKIRYYGLSSICPEVIEKWATQSNISTAMIQYSLLDRRPEAYCLELLKQRSIGVLARGTVAQGLLVNKPPKEYLNYSVEEVGKLAKVVRSVSGQDRSAGHTCIQYVFSNPAVNVALVGLRTEEQLKDVVGAVYAPPLTPAELDFLQNVLPVNFYG